MDRNGVVCRFGALFNLQEFDGPGADSSDDRAGTPTAVFYNDRLESGAVDAGVYSDILRRLRLRTGFWPGRRALEGSLVMELHRSPEPRNIFWCIQTAEEAAALKQSGPSLDRSVYAFSSLCNLSNNDSHFNETSAVLLKLIARHYAAEIRRIQPNGPYFLAGNCSGAETVYEIAQQLVAAGCHVERLLLVEPAQSFEVNGRFHAFLAWLFLKRGSVVFHARRSWARALSGSLNHVGAFFRGVPRKALRALGPSDASDKMTHASERVAAKDRKYCIVRCPGNLRVFPGSLAEYAAVHGAPYIFHPYPGRVTLLFADSSEYGFQRIKALRPYIDAFWTDRALGGFDVNTVPGDHRVMETEAGREAIIAAVRAPAT